MISREKKNERNLELKIMFLKEFLEIPSFSSQVRMIEPKNKSKLNSLSELEIGAI